MKTRDYPLVLMSIVSFSVFASENIEQDNDQLLQTSCQALAITPEHVNAKPCINFLQGFLAAAQAIDPSNINQQSKKKRKSYGFMSRPPRNWDKISSARFPPFCVPDDESKSRVLKNVSKHLLTKGVTEKILIDTILKALKAEYPCSKAESKLNEWSE